MKLLENIDLIMREEEHSDRCKNKSLVIDEEFIDGIGKRFMRFGDKEREIVDVLKDGGIVE